MILPTGKNYQTIVKKEKTYPISKPEREYAEMVKTMFSKIASRYDFMNRLLSFGLDIYWRRKSVQLMNPSSRGIFLDLACGTGDLAILAKEIHRGLRVFGLDFSLKMLKEAKKKLNRKSPHDSIILVAGDALSLPFKDETFDCVSIAFGLRNIPNRKRALLEMKRVTKKGGKIAILEMSSKRNVGFLFRTYLRYIVPFFAKIFSKDPDAYFYLYETISSFPSPLELKEELEMAGMTVVQSISFWPGIAHLILACKVNLKVD